MREWWILSRVTGPDSAHRESLKQHMEFMRLGMDREIVDILSLLREES